MTEIRIYVNQQLDSYTYRLSPQSKVLIQAQPAQTKPVASVFVSFDTETPLEWRDGSLWQHIAEMLTGLTLKQLKKMGSVVFIDPKTKDVLFNSMTENV